MEIHEDEVQSKGRPTVARSSLLVTAVVGLVMLGAGVLAGYFGRPLVTPRPLGATPVTPTVGAANPPAAASDPSAVTLMEAVIAQTRHFKGDPNAPVTIIEFGDFQ